MARLTMRERRELLSYYLQQIADGATNYSISDWVVNRLLLEIIQLGKRDLSIFEVVASDRDKSKLPLSVKEIEEELKQESVFT